MNDSTPRDKPIHLIGAPTDIGAGRRGASMGPEALRVAGIDRVLERLGRGVVDLGNLSGPMNPRAKPVDGYRHLQETTEWCRAVYGAVGDSLRQGALPLLLGGDHCLAIGSIAAVADHCVEQGLPLTVLWLDAHADFNTPKTTPSGNIHGMPVAILCGQGPDQLTGIGKTVPAIEPSRFIQLGIRSVDHQEKLAIKDAGILIYDMRRIDELRMRKVMQEILTRIADSGGHLHLSFDVDFLDPTIAPGVATTVTGGPSYREAQLCMEMLHDSAQVGSIDIMELNPAMDSQNQTAKVAVELIASLFGEQILARHTPFE